MSIETNEIKVTVNGKVVRTIIAEVVPIHQPSCGGTVGMSSDGTIYARFRDEGPALDSWIMVSKDGGRSWKENRINWTKFHPPVAKDLDKLSPLDLFYDRLWAMSNDSFGVLKDGTLILAIHQNPDTQPGGLEENNFVIRSEDEGKTWQDPVKIDKSPFPSNGGSSNRMTELPDGTILWPQRLGLTSSECERIGKVYQLSKRPWEGPPYAGTYVFRSTDGGRTWGDRTLLPDWSFETTILRLHSSRLIAAIRYQPFLASPDLPPGKRVYLADSDDDGRTWVDFRPIRHTLDGPTVLELGEAHGELVQLSDGTLVLVHGRRYPREKAQVRARVSHDEGQTWLPEIYHLSLPGIGARRGYGTGHYTSSVVLEDDTIVTITGAGTCVRWKV